MPPRTTFSRTSGISAWTSASSSVGRSAGAGPQVTSESLGLQFVLSIGAGIYEELVFRVLLVGGFR